jgi:uncharacterized Zn-finger protein
MVLIKNSIRNIIFKFIYAMHSGENPFICDNKECDKKFISKSKYNWHKRQHFCHQKYKCNYNECDMSFVKSKDLKIHIRLILTKNKFFKCVYKGCENIFTHFYNMNKHFKKIHANNK